MQRHEGEHKGLEIKWRGSVVRTGRYRRDRHSYGSGVAKNCERLPFSAKGHKVYRACDYIRTRNLRLQTKTRNRYAEVVDD